MLEQEIYCLSTQGLLHQLRDYCIPREMSSQWHVLLTVSSR